MRTITLETAVAELLRDIADADHKHGADVETIARAYSAICASPEETICVVAGDKTASDDYLDGRPVAAADSNPDKKCEATFAGLALVKWCAEDIQTLRPDWDAAKCNEFLYENEDEIQLQMIDTGWKVIKHHLRYAK